MEEGSDGGGGALAAGAVDPDERDQWAEEAERRATSALLAVMGSVREFGQAIVRALGHPPASLDDVHRGAVEGR